MEPGTTNSDPSNTANVNSPMESISQAIAAGVPNTCDDFTPFYSEEQLSRIQRMEAIGQLASCAAHDFNNILTAIQGSCELAQNHLPRDSAARANIAEIQIAANRASKLVRQLMAFCRQQERDPEPQDLNKLLMNLEPMLRRLIPEDITISLHLGAEGAVLVDSCQIEQAVVNLVVNARDAMPSGGKIMIETRDSKLDEGYTLDRFEAEEARYVLLAVTDNGEGMTPEVRTRIFEPLFTTKDRRHGTGLGLSNLRRIVRQCNGHIRVSSEPGAGSTFKIFLPRLEDAAKLLPKTQHEEPPVTKGGTERILVVEDDHAARAFAVKALANQGYTVLEAKDCDTAVHLLSLVEGRIDLVVTDVVLPEVSGAEVYRQLLHQSPDLRVLYTSGYEAEVVVSHGVVLQDVLFLQKPYTSRALLQAVRKALD